MSLSSGTRLGSYEVLGPLGAGGMGEVYRAQDARLGRAVALKVLPEALAVDGERIARLEREARVLASLNHPHIAALYGFEEAGNRQFLVMELVEGETLAERLARGVIPVNESLLIARQIVEALEAAHEKGVVHRDLKPANIKITPEDRVKVLDFGLARLQEPEAPDQPSTLTHSPTLSVMATQAGIILGTAGYMSPEQAKGAALDQRSDLFSFGVVLYEMLTGRRAFQADTVAETMAAVLMRDADATALPPNLNPRLVELLRRCLEKNPRRRWQAAGDLRAEIETVIAAPLMQPMAAPLGVARPLWRRVLPIVLASIGSAALTGALVWRMTMRPPPAAVAFTFPLDETLQFGVGAAAVRWLSIAPSGDRVVFGRSSGLWVRELSSEPTLVPGTEGIVVEPALAPDGESVVYVTSNLQLRRIEVRGGPITPLATIERPFSLSWTAGGIFVSQPGKIIRVSPSGPGKPEQVITLAAGEQAHGPELLPDGKTLVFAVTRGTGQDAWDSAEIVAQKLELQSSRRTLARGSNPHYLPSGHLLWASGGVLVAAPFDADRLEIGVDAPVLEGVARNISGASHFDVADNGTIAYVPGSTQMAEGAVVQLAFRDDRGVLDLLKVPDGQYEAPRISPDGTQLAVGLTDGRQTDIWIQRLDGTTAPQKLTSGGSNRYPVWSPDSRQVVFQSNRDGSVALYLQSVDAPGPLAKQLTKPDAETSHVPESWSGAGTPILFSAVRELKTGDSEPATEGTLWEYSTRDGKVNQLRDIRSTSALNAELSPNGQLLAYTLRGNQGSVRASVYVTSYPPTGSSWLVASGAHHPIWSADGGTLFYIPNAQPLSAVKVIRQLGGVQFSNREQWPGGLPNVNPFGEPRNFDLDPKRNRFVFTRTARDASDSLAVPQIRVVVNWFEGIAAARARR